MNCSNKSCKAQCLKIALLAIAGIAAVSWLVMLLWNGLMPALFTGANPINYCQAIGLLVLSKILFSGLPRCCHGRHRQHWENMSPEERAELKGKLKTRWGSMCCGDKAADKEDDEASKS